MIRPRSSSVTRNEFSQCALVEIIHLHDCLRGALHEIQEEVESLVRVSSQIDDDQVGRGDSKKMSDDVSDNSGDKTWTSMHTNSSSRSSIITDVDNNNRNDMITNRFDIQIASDLAGKVSSRFHLIWSVFRAHSGAEDEFIWPALKVKVAKLRRPLDESDHSYQISGSTNQSNDTSNTSSSPTKPGCSCAATIFGQEEYEEDHAKEEIMFEQINSTLRRLKGSFRYYHIPQNQTEQSRKEALYIIRQAILLLKKQMDNIVKHLRDHLKKEETDCLPIVKKHLTNEEITTLVGNIMGQRSAEVMTNILNLAVCSLPAEDRADMVKHMKNAMTGTFFERWLKMGGWDGGQDKGSATGGSTTTNSMESRSLSSDSLKRKLPNSTGMSDEDPLRKKMATSRNSRSRYPSRWYREDEDGNVKLAWCSSDPESTDPEILPMIPAFTQSELIPTYHFSSNQGGPVLGCDHYARACKLRHPSTGTLFTCRLCCQEQREAAATHNSAQCGFNQVTPSLPMLDRHAVSEVLCMRCGALQPVGRSCINPDCSPKKPYARYSCTICRLFDDAPSKHIYHCPYCNACRKGRGLGIDFRHCMRCNACISVDEYEEHVCIPQRLQGNCPICQVELFDSTEPLRGLRCGHVMHLSCFNRYMVSCDTSRKKITCPQCKVAVDLLRG